MQHYWIQFTNGYTAEGWRFALNSLGSLIGDVPFNPVADAHRSINAYVAMCVNAETRGTANMFLHLLVGFTEGLALAAPDNQVYQRIYQYMYDALALAYIVDYDDRLDD